MSGLPMENLILEITEGIIMDEVAAAALHHESLQGARLALDDFGSGYSSYGSLRTMNIDLIKIDRMFVDDCQEIQGGAVLGAISALAEALTCRTIGEGLETEGQIDAYSRLGVDIGQGFGLSRPMNAERFEAFLQQAIEPIPTAI